MKALSDKHGEGPWTRRSQPMLGDGPGVSTPSVEESGVGWKQSRQRLQSFPEILNLWIQRWGLALGPLGFQVSFQAGPRVWLTSD